MSSHTERIHRILVLWLDLQQALQNHRHKPGPRQATPWESPDPQVKKIWQKITEPGNHQALEEWMFQICDGEQATWAQHALLESRRRKAVERT